MALPEGGKTAWPPKDIAPYTTQADASAAWWSGDTAKLKDTAGHGAADQNRRRFWQRRKTGDKTTASNLLHAPLAGDIAAVSAELLFGEEITLTVENDPAQTEIQYLEEQLGLANLFLEGAETCAATGGVYLRQAWDTDVADHGLLQIYSQTHAVPDFRYRRLTGVTLWEDVHVEGADVWRHLERHEKGRILHGLYQGSKTELGQSVSLEAHPATADLAPELILPGRLADRLLVSYVPNVLPNPRLPQKPIGRADWTGAEDFLDALDETWTSLIRDFRLGQARVFVAEDWLKATGTRPGQQATLDMDTEIFTALNIADDTDKRTIDTHQPELRVTEHLEATLALTERIVSRAGYSPQTFGLSIEGSAESGTALRIREGKTDKTVSKKQRYWIPGIQQTVTNLLDIGAEVFNRPAAPDGVRVNAEFPELQQDPAERALWIKSLRDARAMSVHTAVRAAQPDLDEDEAEEETARIQAEDSFADPTIVGRGPDVAAEGDPLTGE